ncbi:hypothetical protein MXMO3_01713 [Maritalea myrionectae]|uniref:Uncharacterized protein n=1 Tax=Maritalea myrionectae TaxID=454601 RepID=A0A2R4MEE9_9HYPH|nr:hypothetical protein [Maritalea myrionectae]AVX04239.1 hypothetical protein MXMO3_01713 [Maritalea myrionectae]
MASLATIATVVSAAGTIAGGIAANAAAQDEARQLEAKGKEEFAASQREAEIKRQEGRLIMSRQQALAAASGAGAGDDAPTILKLMSGTARESEFNAQVEMFGGKSRKSGLFNAASNRRREGAATLLGSVTKAVGGGIRGLNTSGAFG